MLIGFQFLMMVIELHEVILKTDKVHKYDSMFYGCRHRETANVFGKYGTQNAIETSVQLSWLL